MSAQPATQNAPQLAEQAVSAFGAQLRGELIQPGDARYEDARKLYNAMIDKRPALIAGCKDVADVIHAVNFGRDNQLTVAIRGGGHNGPGLGTCENGLVIDLSRMRGIHVTGWLAHHGVICGGPRVGRQPTFVLLDAWVAPTTPKTRDEALHTLALRYFHSHGPATAQDLAWWSGLTVRDAQLAAALAEPELQVLEAAGVLWEGTAEPPER